jgi:hypothetical protein
MVTAVPISCADFPGTVNLLDRVWRGIAFCVMITYLSVAITSLEVDLHTAEGHEQ